MSRQEASTSVLTRNFVTITVKYPSVSSLFFVFHLPKFIAGSCCDNGISFVSVIRLFVFCLPELVSGSRDDNGISFVPVIRLFVFRLPELVSGSRNDNGTSFVPIIRLFVFHLPKLVSGSHNDNSISFVLILYALLNQVQHRESITWLLLFFSTLLLFQNYGIPLSQNIPS